MTLEISLLLGLLLMSSRSPAQTNIAIGRPVSASAQTWSGQVPANLTDGNEANQSHPLASSGTLGFYYENGGLSSLITARDPWPICYQYDQSERRRFFRLKTNLP